MCNIDMRRAAKTVWVGSVAIIFLGCLVYVCVVKICARQMAADDLSWLKREFRLTESEMQRVRQLHEGYLPKCREMCGKIAAKQSEVNEALTKGQAADEKLMELATVRAQCQAQMLRHFQEVSQAMPAKQGKRYLSEMQRLTLGSHQDIERAMDQMPTSGHGN
jgi:hypothetical protein